jgi:dimethylaniline monooxygenase (N-oxide forming)
MLDSVHGEYRFSSLPMPPPANDKATGGRLTGIDVQKYLEIYAERFLKGKTRYDTEVLNIRRPETGVDNGDGNWIVTVRDVVSNVRSELWFDKLVLCSGVSFFFAMPAFNLWP